MNTPTNSIEQFWDMVLSRDPEKVRRAAASLTPAEAAKLTAHLEDMAHGEGWQDEQRLSAEAALKALGGKG
jgi:DNA-binding GntR family transcriptional regulator